MRFTMEVESGNEAVTEEGIAVMLDKVAQRIRQGDLWDKTNNVMDENGNRVGSWKLAED